MKRRPTRNFRAGQSKIWITVRNLVRRVLPRDTDTGDWTFDGFTVDGATEGDNDSRVPVFAGMGVYVRPKSSDNAEAVLVNIGAHPDHGVVVAVRNEDARRRYVENFGDIEEGELALFNSDGDTRLILTDAGEVRVESASKGAQSLALKSDVDDLASWAQTHVHSPTTPFLPTTTAPSASGTSVLKGE